MQKITQLVLVFVSCLVCSLASAQSNEGLYQWRTSQELPAVLKKSPVDLFNERVRGLKTTEEDEDFLLRTSYSLYELMHSGEVLFSDPLSQYVQGVADKLLQHDSKLKERTQFYVIKSGIPNAFATDQGVIFVSVGLLSRLEDESQLAFVLAHEVAHVVKDHVLNSFQVNQKIEEGSGGFKKGKAYDKLLFRSNYSRRNEMEADSLGLAIFQESPYSTESVPQVFDILKNASIPPSKINTSLQLFQLSHTPWEKVVSAQKTSTQTLESLDKSGEDNSFVTGFEHLDLRNMEVGSSTEVDSIFATMEDDASDEFATHPAPMKRKRKVQDMLGGASDGSTFLSSPADFFQIRQTARHLTAQFFAENQYFYETYFHAMLLLQDDMEDPVGKELLTYSLYAIARYRLYGKSFPRLYNFRRMPHEQQAWVHIMERMDKEELMMLALDRCWTHYNTRKRKGAHWLMCRDLGADMLMRYRNWEDATKASEEVSTALQYFKSEAGFDKIYDAADKKREKRADWEDFWEQDDKVVRKGLKELAQANENKRLGLSKAVVLKPTLFVGSGKKDFFRKEHLQAQADCSQGLHGRIKNAARAKGIGITLMHTGNKGSLPSPEALSNYALLGQWMSERLSHKIPGGMVCSTHDLAEAAMQKLGTQNLVLLGLFAPNSIQGYTLAPRPVRRHARSNGASFVSVFNIEANKLLFATDMDLAKVPSWKQIESSLERFMVNLGKK